jgi:hypothetical protein
LGKLKLKLLLAAVVAILGFFVYQQHRIAEEAKKRKRAELEAGLRLSEVLTEVFTKRAEVRVATLSGRARSQGQCVSGYFFPNKQMTIAPYTASYFVNVDRVDRSDFRWDGTSRTMFVEVPDPAPERSNIDMSQAKSDQSGIYVSRSCGLTMQQQVAGRLSAVADKAARSSENMRKARDAGRETLGGLFHAALAAASNGSAKVVIRFASEPRPTGDGRWDTSRSISEVLADPAFK